MNDKALLGAFNKSGGGPLRHVGLLDATVDISTMSHCISTGMGRVKKAILTESSALQLLYEAGTAVSEEVRHIKEGHPDTNKEDWVACWHVRGNAKVNKRKIKYDFTVSIDKDTFVHIYDLTVKRA